MARDVAINNEGQISTIQMQAILTIAKLYSRFGDHEDPDKIPIQVYGSSNLPEHQSHIFDSMIGKGSNGRPTPAILTKGEPIDNNARNFLRRKSACGNLPRNGLACDEYPYATTLQGGKDNFDLGLVSARLVNGSESRMQAGFNTAFYGNSPVNIGDNFLVIPLGGESGYFDRKWKWHPYPKPR